MEFVTALVHWLGLLVGFSACILTLVILGDFAVAVIRASRAGR
jgi:hypothetical protein